MGERQEAHPAATPAGRFHGKTAVAQRLEVAEELLAASEALQRDFAARQRGFVRRELLRGAHGQWADLVHWEDEAAAHAVFAAALESPVCAEYFKLMVMPEGVDPAASVLHLSRVREYAAS